MIASESKKNSKRAALSLNEQAYATFRHALITLKYKPGEYLNTVQVMADLDMGRTPINQAIHRLASEGLLTILPRKGVIVSPLSIDDALKMIDVRLVNELLCIKLVCEKVTPADIARLKSINAQIDEASEMHDTSKMVMLDSRFHQELLIIADNKWLSDILMVIHAQAQRFWASTLSNVSHMKEVVVEHKTIIDALEKRDFDLAKSMTMDHILSYKRSLVSL